MTLGTFCITFDYCQITDFCLGPEEEQVRAIERNSLIKKNLGKNLKECFLHGRMLIQNFIGMDLAYMSLNNAFDNPKTAAKASSVLAIVGLVNIPIIYYSVDWWNSLHQGSSVSVTKVSMQSDMFIALMLMSFAFKFLYGALVLLRARDEVLVREQNSRWVKDIITGGER